MEYTRRPPIYQTTSYEITNSDCPTCECPTCECPSYEGITASMGDKRKSPIYLKTTYNQIVESSDTNLFNNENMDELNELNNIEFKLRNFSEIDSPKPKPKSTVKTKKKHTKLKVKKKINKKKTKKKKKLKKS
jgi:hypothetical protein